jgi:hypothetical protein
MWVRLGSSAWHSETALKFSLENLFSSEHNNLKWEILETKSDRRPSSPKLYSVIQKDGLNFVNLYFKIGTSDKYDVNYIWLEVECWNEDETHAAQQSPTQF